MGKAAKKTREDLSYILPLGVSLYLITGDRTEKCKDGSAVWPVVTRVRYLAQCEWRKSFAFCFLDSFHNQVFAKSFIEQKIDTPPIRLTQWIDSSCFEE